MIYIMTWYRGMNYGSVLQAYALQRYILSLGYSCRILNYAPGKPASLKMKILNGSLRDTLIYKFNECTAGASGNRADRNITAFDSFREEYMDITGRCRNADEILKLCGEDSVFVCGSDQIWNPYFYDPCYFLTFAKDKNKKIAYAPSFGVSEANRAVKKRIAAALDGFGSISVREETGKEIIKDLTGKEAVVTADPTMLADMRQWDLIAEDPEEKEPYLFCYFLSSSGEYLRAAEKTAAARGLKIRMLPMTASGAANENVIKEAVGPREWLGYIKNADFVMTDSFHCTLFAMRYRRQFITLKRFSDDDPRGQNGRISSFLNETEMAGRFINASDMTGNEPGITADMFARACGIIDKKAEYSGRWLAHNLKKAKEADNGWQYKN